jgi:hypothetical protein
MDSDCGLDSYSAWRRSNQSKRIIGRIIVVRTEACNTCRGDKLEATGEVSLSTRQLPQGEYAAQRGRGRGQPSS